MKIIIFGILIITILISGCIETPTGQVVKETVNVYVCPDGSNVDSPDKCEIKKETPPKEPPCVEEKIGEDYCLTPDKVGYDQRQCPNGNIIKIVKNTCSEGCSGGKCIETSTHISSSSSDELDDAFEDFAKALEDLEKSLEDSSRISSKIDECTKKCSGDDYDIPVIRNEFYMACYQMYYYTGEEGLDKYMQEC